MSLERYKELSKMKDFDVEYPADFTSYVSRDACEFEGSGGAYPHWKSRFGQNTECPDGEYYLVKPLNPKRQKFKVYVSDNPKTNGIKPRAAKEPYCKVFQPRGGIALHWYDASGSVGCITFQEKPKSKSNFNRFYANLSDLYLEVEGESRIVRLILEPRTDLATVAYGRYDESGNLKDTQYLYLSKQTQLPPKPGKSSSNKSSYSKLRLQSAYFEDTFGCKSLGPEYVYIGIVHNPNQTDSSAAPEGKPNATQTGHVSTKDSRPSANKK